MHAGHTYWDNFPHSILTPQAARWYVNAFLASFNQANLTKGEQHALRVCCLLAIPPPPPGIGDVTLDISSDLSQVHLTAIVRIVEDLASGMGRLSPHIEDNHAVISRTLIPHLEKIMNHASCMTCLRPRQMFECLVPTSYDQLRTSPPAFTTFTSTVPHQVTSKAGGLHTMRMPSFGTSRATTWPSMGATSTATGWTLPGQPVFPHSNIGNARPFHWTDNGWYAFLQYGRHASTEADPPHHTITTASPTGYPLHPSCRCASKSHLHSQDQYPLGCSLLLLRSSEDIHLYQWTTTRPLYREKNYVLLIRVFKAAGPIPETVLKESAQERTREIPHHWRYPCQGSPKGPNVVPQFRMDSRCDSPYELVLIQRGERSLC